MHNIVFCGIVMLANFVHHIFVTGKMWIFRLNVFVAKIHVDGDVHSMQKNTLLFLRPSEPSRCYEHCNHLYAKLQVISISCPRSDGIFSGAVYVQGLKLSIKKGMEYIFKFCLVASDSA